MFELYLITFNCARNLVSPEALAPGLFNALPKTAAVPDVVAISLQELAPIAYSFLGGSYLKPYFDRINTAVHLAVDLRSSGTEHLQHVATRSLGMTALAIFAKPQFAERIQWAQSAGAGVGFWDMGNKGAVAMRLGVACPGSDETLNLTFTAAHLAPMECNIEARNKDWENLVRNLVFVSDDDSGYSSIEDAPLLSSASSPRPQDEHNGIFASGNHVFFAGDLNYRTHETPPGPNAHKSYPQPNASESSPAHYSHFLDKDQLTRERKANRTLHNFDELPIRFLPTYKLSISKDVTEGPISEDSKSWKWAKHRYPSWCDRILFLHSDSSRFEPQVYTVLPIQPTSDHRPVALSVRVEEEPLSQDAVDMLHPNPPFPINPHWRTRRDVARRWEVTVGVLSYLALTRKGNAIVVAIAGVLFGSWWVAAWLGH